MYAENDNILVAHTTRITDAKGLERCSFDGLDKKSVYFRGFEVQL